MGGTGSGAAGAGGLAGAGGASSSSGNFRGVSLGNVPCGCTEENGFAGGMRYASSGWLFAELSNSFGATGPPVVLADPTSCGRGSAWVLRLAHSQAVYMRFVLYAFT